MGATYVILHAIQLRPSSPPPFLSFFSFIFSRACSTTEPNLEATALKNRSMRRCLFLASALLLALVASSEAVVCDSFKQRSECENIVTDAGICGWDEAAAKCVVTQRLPYGMVGITSVKPPQKVENRSAPGGKRGE